MKTQKKMSAFTLIEMVLVLFIISLLLLLVIPNINHQRQRANTINTEALDTQFKTQAQLYLEEHPTVDKVSTSELLKDGYLTEEQAEKIGDREG